MKRIFLRKNAKEALHMEHVGIILLIFALTLASGWGDSQGFIHASNIWHNGRLVWIELAKSAFGFGLGSVMYWIALRYLEDFGIVSPEIQTLGWFSITIVGIALASGNFFRWHIIDQLVGLVVVSGIAWLLIRTVG